MSKEKAEIKHVKENEWMALLEDKAQIYQISVSFRNLLVDTATKEGLPKKIHWRVEE